MLISNSFFGILVLCACVLSFSSASPAADEKAISCNDPKVKSLLSTVKSVANAQATSFCSSYLHYTQPVKTVTATTVSTTTVTATVKKGVKTVTVTVTSTKIKRQEADAKAAGPTLSADSQGKVSGFPSEIVSAACACLVTKPTKTSTITKTSTKVTTSTKTVTIPKSTETKTITVTTTTGTATLTQCDSPDATFYIQFKDPNSARTDQYNNNYLKASPDTYRGTGIGYVWDVTTSLANAVLLTRERATRRIKTLAEGWYADAEYYLNITPVYFDPEDFVIQQDFQFLDCNITSSNLLNCYVPYPSPRRIIETCPQYVEFYETPVELGDKEYRDGPVCYTKNMVVIPYCMPKKTS